MRPHYECNDDKWNDTMQEHFTQKRGQDKGTKELRAGELELKQDQFEQDKLTMSRLGNRPRSSLSSLISLSIDKNERFCLLPLFISCKADSKA